jgi:hypothetical protein
MRFGIESYSKDVINIPTLVSRPRSRYICASLDSDSITTLVLIK